MLAHRIIPCLDCDLNQPGGRVVKGIRFKRIRYAGLPWELAEAYYKEGADEIVFLDITASAEKRTTMVEVVEKTTKRVFVPIAVGGGIKTLEDARCLFKAGADKVSVNTAAIQNPRLVSDLSKTFGAQAVVVAIDAKRNYKCNTGKVVVKTEQGDCWFECSIYGGRKFTGVDAVEWAKRAEELGAGEILLTSMDRDGTKQGFDIDLTKKVTQTLSIPVIASGGGGKKEHFAEVFQEAGADAALAASLFHFQEVTIPDVKEYLKERGINVRP